MSACSAYALAKPLRPIASPATRNSQPIRFSARRDARTNPATGTATFTSWLETLVTVQPVTLAGTSCRSTYDSTSPVTISATDTAAADPATRWAASPLSWNPGPPFMTGAGLGAG